MPRCPAWIQATDSVSRMSVLDGAQRLREADLVGDALGEGRDRVRVDRREDLDERTVGLLRGAEVPCPRLVPLEDVRAELEPELERVEEPLVRPEVLGAVGLDLLLGRDVRARDVEAVLEASDLRHVTCSLPPSRLVPRPPTGRPARPRPRAPGSSARRPGRRTRSRRSRAPRRAQDALELARTSRR